MLEMKKSVPADRSLGPNAALRGMPRSRERLTTPALLLDLDDFEHNLRDPGET